MEETGTASSRSRLGYCCQNMLMSGETTVPFSTPWFDILATKINDSEAPYYYLRLPDYVTVVATTSRNSVLLVRQYRPAVECHVLELPSGTVDPESCPRTQRGANWPRSGYHAPNLALLGSLLPDCGRLSNSSGAITLEESCRWRNGSRKPELKSSNAVPQS